MPQLECGFPNTDQYRGQDVLAFAGPTLAVDIGFDPTADYVNLSGTLPQSQAVGIYALLDTGAGESCIDDALAKKIGLPIVDRVTVSGVGGRTEVNVYLAHLIVPGLGYIQ